MSAQRRTAGKRGGSATATPPRRIVTNGERGAPAATAVAQARPAPSPPRPPKSAVDRGKTAPTPAERGRFSQRFDGLRQVYGDTVAEMKKINWPDRETTKNLTIVVIGITLALAIVLGGVDFLLQKLFEILP